MISIRRTAQGLVIVITAVEAGHAMALVHERPPGVHPEARAEHALPADPHTHQHDHSPRTPYGPVGIAGATGATGAQGSQGFTGATGATGAGQTSF